MPDRIAEIRARLDKWKRQTDAMKRYRSLPEKDRPYIGTYCADACGCGEPLCGNSDEWYPVWQHEGEIYDHSVDDIKWLLDEVERLQSANASE